MKAVSRGILIVLGLVTGFFTLVFIFQFIRYLNIALVGDQLSIGMAAVYAVMTYAGVVVTILAFKPSTEVAKYLSGVGAVVTVGFAFSSLYLLIVDLASGMMILIITAGQVVVVGAVYVGAVIRSKSSYSESKTDSTHPTESSEVQESQSESDTNTDSNSVAAESDSMKRETQSKSNSELDTDASSGLKTGRDINWKGSVQIFAGVAIFLVGIPITIQSPVGVPILLIGLGLIPRIRSWSIKTLDNSNSDV